MKLGLDLTALTSGDTGVARYTSELHASLERRFGDIELRTFAIGRGDLPSVPVTRRIHTPLRIVHKAWETFGWPSAERLIGAVDVVHSIDMVPPPTRHPLVMTIHDVLPLRLPEHYGPRFIQIARGFARAAARADAIITTCHSSAAEVADVTGIPLSRITVAPLGRRSPGAPARSPIEPPYILYIGSITPRKGLHRLAEAMTLLPPGTPPLVVAGPDGWAAERVHERIRSLARGPTIHWLGRVSDATLDALLCHATLLCHPSEAEGFGIPCLEAMGAGVPVVAGDIPPVREIGGGAICLVPARDPEALAHAIADLLNDPERRQQMAEAGRRQAEPYTWDAMTDRIVEVYRSLT